MGIRSRICGVFNLCPSLSLHYGDWAAHILGLVVESTSRRFTECFHSDDYHPSLSVTILEQRWNPDQQEPGLMLVMLLFMMVTMGQSASLNA